MTTAFALSGGGNLGPMQAGAVVALFEAGIEPDLLVGTSVGALNGAFLSTRLGLEGARELLGAWTQLRRREVAVFSPVSLLAGFLGIQDHLLSARRLRALIGTWVEVDRLEETTIPFAAVATDALSGEAVVLRRGSAADALCASAAIPGLLPPVRIAGHWLIDGSLSAGCPVLQAQALGADDVYMIATATAPRRRLPRGAVAMAMNSVSLVTARSNLEQHASAQAAAARRGGALYVVPTGEPPAPGPFDLRRSAELARIAYTRAKAWLASVHAAPYRTDAESIS